MTYVIGIDGGGTKTEAVLANIDGEIMAKAIGGPTNPNLLSKEELYQTFETLLRGIEVQAPEQYKKVGSLFAGISGAGIKQSRTDLYETILELVPDNVKVQVEADTINALYSGTYGASGIVQIAGTGSITYGINDKSEHDRVGGWGYLFGDEGSGFDIGRRGIIAVLKSEDGRGNETILVDMVFKHFTVTTARELIQKIYTSQVPKNEISPLSKIVFQAYKQRDELAIAIINEVAEEISKSIITLYEKLFNSQENTRVVLCGGVFQDREVLPQLIQQRLNNYMNITLFQPKIQPVGGSVIGAYLMDEILPTSTVIGNIIKTLKRGGKVMVPVKGGLVILKEMLNTLPPSERKIAEYIINSPGESIQLTALMLGEKSKTSGAAVIRLCKSLGFNGFQELKIRVAGDLQGEFVTEYRDIEPNEEYKDIIEKVTSNTIQTLKDTIDIMSEKSLEKAVDALINAKSIIFIGFGASYISAEDAEQKFLRINKNVQSFSDVHIAATSIANKGPEDVIIGISFSGATNGVAKLLELAQKKGSTTISITKYGQSLVANYSDIKLHTSAAREATFRSGATSSRIAQLHIIDILFMCLASKEYEETIKYLDATREAVAFLKE